MTIRIDVDEDGQDDARFPLKWAIIGLTALLGVCGITRLGLAATVL